MRLARLVTSGCLFILIGGTIYQAVSLFRHEQRAHELETALVAVPEAITRLERFIGYGGLIHDFKNFVLRPEEKRYRDQVETSAGLALEQVDRLAELAADTGIALSFDALRAMLAAYRARLDVVTAMAAEERPARAIDNAVRYDDQAALSEIDHALRTLTDYYRERLQDEISTTRTRSAFVFLLGLWTIPLGVVALRHDSRLRQEQRMQTELRRLLTIGEQEIDRGRVMLDKVFSAVRGGVVALDDSRMVVMANPAARQMLGGALDALPAAWPDSLSFFTRTGLNALDGDQDPVSRAIARQKLDGEVHAMWVGGSAEHRYVRVSAASVDDVDTPVRAVIVLDEVTEEERRRQQTERGHRLDALGQLTGGIAHDFNNLLGTMRLAVDVAMRSDDLTAKDSGLDLVSRTVQKGADLTARLLAFGSGQSDNAEPVLVSEIVNSVADLARHTIEATITIDITLDDETLVVLADPSQLENALLNLVLNARDAIMETGKGDRILIEALAISQPIDETAAGEPRTGSFVDISVNDNGPGMAKAVQDRAVDPFFTTKEAAGGSGLGLSMVYGFVQHGQGMLRIYSEEDLGTTVRMLLPKTTLSATKTLHDKPAELIPGRDETVLIVEDKADLLEATERSLASLNYRTIGTQSPAAALELLADGKSIDLLLTDIVMPGGMNGLALAAQAREQRPNLPVVYMSGYAGSTVSRLGKVDAPFIQKPCTIEALSWIIRQALDQPPRQAAGRLKSTEPSSSVLS